VSNRWPGKTVIGLTGNIATGKSIVRRMLEHLGAFGIDADGLAHRAMSQGAPAFKPIVDTFGKFVLGANGEIDREKLGNIVFSDPAALAQLEAITHPLLKQVMDILIKRATQPVVVIEAIKLYEAGMAEMCDAVWIVDAPEDVQLKRLVQQRKLSEPAAKMRIAAQPPQTEKLAKAKVTINNAGGYEMTLEQVQKHYEALTGKKVEEVEEAPVKVEVKPEIVPIATAGSPMDVEISIQRGGPKHAEAIAAFVSQSTGTPLTRTDVLMRFGQKAYMLAYSGEKLLALAGWQVENLIARTDEFVIGADAPREKTTKALVEQIEKNANGLQAEISLVYLKNNTHEDIRRAVLVNGYEQQTPADFRVPDWREAAEESMPPDSYLVVKRLRADRVLKPV
jgi:dephospho-CoA kinase